MAAEQVAEHKRARGPVARFMSMMFAHSRRECKASWIFRLCVVKALSVGAYCSVPNGRHFAGAVMEGSTGLVEAKQSNVYQASLFPRTAARYA